MKYHLTTPPLGARALSWGVLLGGTSALFVSLFENFWVWGWEVHNLTKIADLGPGLLFDP